MRCKLIPAFLLLVCASAYLEGPGEAQNAVTGEEPLARPVVSLVGSSPVVDLAFQTAIHGSGARGGEVIVEGCSDKSQTVVHFQGNSLREVLEDIIQADPEYVWNVDDGVVNLVPAKGLPDLLGLHITSFDSGDEMDPVSAITFLLALPEVQEREEELGFSKGRTGTGPYAVVPGAKPAHRPLNVRLKDVTLFDALNAVVRASKHGLWVYRETHCKSQNFLSIDATD